MAGTSEVLQEYLVRLGYQIDTVSQRKFSDGMGLMTKRVLRVGGAVFGMVAAMEAASAKFAYSMRKVYFESELANSSAKNLKAIGYAGKQIGVESETMRRAVGQMAQSIRLNPGLQALVESFGVKVTGRDMSDVMVDYVKALKDMPEYVATQYAGLFGIDPDTYHQMINHMDKLQEKRKELLDLYRNTGVDPDAAKQVILEYTSGLDNLQAKLTILGQAMMIKFLPQFKALNEVVNNSIDWWIGWANGINSVGKALDGITIPKALDFLNSLIGGETEADRKVREMMGLPDPKAKDAEEARKRWGGAGANVNRWGGEVKGPTAPKTALPAPSASPSTGNVATPKLGAAENVIQQLMKYGWTREQAAGIAANLQRESAFDPTALGDSGRAYGLAQWHPDRQAEFQKWSGKNIRQSTFDEQIAFLNHELTQGNERRAGVKLRGATSAGEAGDVVSRYYERPKDTEGEAALRAALATKLAASTPTQVIIHQKTDINVTGTSPEATAKSVATAQTRVNGDLIRNMSGALR